MALVNLKSLDKPSLEEFMKKQGLPVFRARQLIHWIYEKNVASIAQITEFSKPLREKLAAAAFIGGPLLKERLVSVDGTEKYLLGLEDGNSVECVLINMEPEASLKIEESGAGGKLTLCVSSQVGCAMGCRFCLTGKMGFIRNLEPHEIVDQVLFVERLISPRKIANLVFMGMGEPLANLQNVSGALRRLTDFMRISGRRITLSTSGIVPGILELPRTAPMINLAVSLNATTDETRSRIMPVNRKYGLASLLNALRQFPLPGRSRITFEYVLLAGINDTDEDAFRLIKLLHGIPSKVNLIPFNGHEEADFSAPSPARVLAFQKILVGARLAAFIRKSKGQDILAACGQLKAAYEVPQVGKSNMS